MMMTTDSCSRRGKAVDLLPLGDVNEMILDALAAVETGGAGLRDNRLEIAVVGVVQHAGEVAAGPEFVAGGVDPADSLERGHFAAHVQDSHVPQRFVASTQAMGSYSEFGGRTG